MDVQLWIWRANCKVILGFSIAWGSVSLTPTLFNDQLCVSTHPWVSIQMVPNFRWFNLQRESDTQSVKMNLEFSSFPRLATGVPYFLVRGTQNGGDRVWRPGVWKSVWSSCWLSLSLPLSPSPLPVVSGS